MVCALVLGANGQDGTLLVRHLLRCGHRVVGVGLQARSGQPADDLFEYSPCDVRDRGALERILSRVQPDWVFHLAAVHASAERNQYEPHFADMLSVNVSSLHVLLEHARVRSRDMRLLYAGSSKCFGDPLPRTIDDETPRVASCLYGISKNTGAALVEYYRRKHDIAAGVLYLFNHESVLRPPEFFIPKVAQAIALARRGSSVKAAFQSLDFSCDWGCADEYMKIAMDLIATLPGQDFVVATGESRNARELVATAFARFGLDAWDHVTAPRGVERPAYEVRPERLRRGLGRVPTCRIDDVLVEMVDAYGDGSGKLEPHDLHRH